MTLGRDGRGSGRRAWRPAAGRDDRTAARAPKPWEAGPDPWAGPEIEELPAQPVIARGERRLGLSAAVAVGVVLAILAAGFGVLGGRPAPSPTRPAAAAASATTSIAQPSAAPLVTPAVPCLPLARALPEVRLIAADRGIPGAVTVFEWTQAGAQPSPAIVLRNLAPSRTELRSDVLAEIRTVGDACASAWTINLADSNDEIGLEGFESGPGDDARQNRFALDLGRYRGRDYDLQSNLTFPEVAVRTTWPIRILPFEAPSPTLTRGGKDIDIKPGCDVELRLGNGYSELVNPCFGELDQLPETATIRGAGSGMTFAFPEGWFILDSSVTCGLLSEQRLTLDQGCDIGSSDQGTSVSIFGPTTAGTWTLGISGCGTQFLGDATNRVCGTWYATIEVDLS